MIFNIFDQFGTVKPMSNRSEASETLTLFCKCTEKSDDFEGMDDKAYSRKNTGATL